MKSEFENYYKVTCKCGHVGRRKYVPICFPIIAESGREAAKKARQLPRVKKQRKDAIINVEKIDQAKYFELIKINNNDPYLKCTNKQQQRKIENFNERVITDIFLEKSKSTLNKIDKNENYRYKCKKIKEKYGSYVY